MESSRGTISFADGCGGEDVGVPLTSGATHLDAAIGCQKSVLVAVDLHRLAESDDLHQVEFRVCQDEAECLTRAGVLQMSFRQFSRDLFRGHSLGKRFEHDLAIVFFVRLEVHGGIRVGAVVLCTQIPDACTIDVNLEDLVSVSTGIDHIIVRDVHIIIAGFGLSEGQDDRHGEHGQSESDVSEHFSLLRLLVSV